MKQTPLSTTHARLGAVFAELAGWEIPRHYGDPAKEHGAVRGGVGLCDRSFLGKIQVGGKDRQEFLHSLVSNNVKRLRAGEGTYATLLTPKGKMIGDLWIYIQENACWILTEPCTTQTIEETLEKYILMSDVTLENQTESYGVISIFGPQSILLV
ncbi:MAG TPA: aminomethyl transferase family protein, partial [bacterium]|nr:aminomethyl transferase family protein [bacterium]